MKIFKFYFYTDPGSAFGRPQEYLTEPGFLTLVQQMPSLGWSGHQPFCVLEAEVGRTPPDSAHAINHNLLPFSYMMVIQVVLKKD